MVSRSVAGPAVTCWMRPWSHWKRLNAYSSLLLVWTCLDRNSLVDLSITCRDSNCLPACCLIACYNVCWTACCLTSCLPACLSFQLSTYHLDQIGIAFLLKKKKKAERYKLPKTQWLCMKSFSPSNSVS